MADTGEHIPRPLPLPDDASAPFWQACTRNELAVQRCASCAQLRFPPRPMCAHCQSMDDEWVTVSGRGTIYSFVIAHRPVLPAFSDRLPLPIVLVELDEGTGLRMVGNLVADSTDGLAIGAAVEVEFDDVGDGVSLPVWRIVR